MSEREDWHRRMQAQMMVLTPWRAEASEGVWCLKNSRGDSLARFNLDSGHACRLAASAPDLLAALQEYADAPCETVGLEDIEVGCCRPCRTRAAIARAVEVGK